MEIDDVNYAINGAVFEVNKILGPGFLEKVYENAMLVELSKRGIKAESQVPINVSYKDQQVGEYVADLFIEDKVIGEMKTVNQLEKIHEAQLLNYLKAKDIEVGLLLNYGPKPEIKRKFMDNYKKSTEYFCGVEKPWG